MRKSIYIVFFSILLITSVRDNSLLSSVLLQILLLILIKDIIIKWIVSLYWQKKESQNLTYKAVDSVFVTKGYAASVIIPKIFFEYSVGNKNFQGSFTYDSSFFTSYADTAVNFFGKINKIEFYYNPKKPCKYFVCKPLSKDMLVELNIVKIISVISLIFLFYNLYLNIQIFY